jgi:hypothetical protein
MMHVMVLHHYTVLGYRALESVFKLQRLRCAVLCCAVLCCAMLQVNLVESFVTFDSTDSCADAALRRLTACAQLA